MPSTHSKLSPSSADRWIPCPASVALVDTLPKESSDGGPYAREGTLAHGLAELEAGLAFGLITQRVYARGLKAWRAEFDEQGYEEGTLEEMQGYVQEFVAFIAERMEAHPNSYLKLEQRMESGIPESKGTSDVVIFSPKHIEIIDLKYGAGVIVSAYDNNQLRIYGLGALLKYGDVLADTELVTVTIYQPRAQTDSITSSQDIHPDELRRWRDEVAIPSAELALSGKGDFGPSEKACRWCPAKGICRARMEASTLEDFGTPYREPKQADTLTPEEIGEVLKRIPDIKAWCAAVEEAALEMAYAKGVHIPGWKLVKSGGRRTITDPTAAIQTLMDAGYNAEQVADFKVKGLGVLEKLVGKKELPEILGGLLVKGEGRESLVHEKDPRPEISPAGQAIAEFEGLELPT